jgi:histidyl-tRNA synthetase
MNYANAKGIPYVIMAGENERNQGVYTLKNMQTGEQQAVTVKDIVGMIR